MPKPVPFLRHPLLWRAWLFSNAWVTTKDNTKFSTANDPGNQVSPQTPALAALTYKSHISANLSYLPGRGGGYPDTSFSWEQIQENKMGRRGEGPEWMFLLSFSFVGLHKSMLGIFSIHITSLQRPLWCVQIFCQRLVPFIIVSHPSLHLEMLGLPQILPWHHWMPLLEYINYVLWWVSMWYFYTCIMYLNHICLPTTLSGPPLPTNSFPLHK